MQHFLKLKLLKVDGITCEAIIPFHCFKLQHDGFKLNKADSFYREFTNL